MQDEVKFVFWDVQHGNATYIKTPNDKHIVIDLGIGSYSKHNEDFSPILRLRDRWRVRQLDYVIITHPHRDHVDDIANFDVLSPKVLIRPRHLSDNDISGNNQARDAGKIQKYLSISDRYSQPLSESDNIENPNNLGGVKFQLFYPRNCPKTNLNNHSIVTVVTYLGCKMLIPGDNEAKSWEELLEQPNFVSAIDGTHVLLASHHGREAGFSAELFNYISPKLTIISDGSAGNTSATHLYGAKTKGWPVTKRSGESRERKWLTTRSDGPISVTFGKSTDGSPYIYARCD